MYQNTPEWWRDEWPVVAGVNMMLALAAPHHEGISDNELRLTAIIGCLTTAVQDSREEIDELRRQLERLNRS